MKKIPFSEYHFRRLRSSGLICLFAVFVLAGCDSTEPYEEDRIIDGVNFTELFAEPRPAEKEAVLDDWQSRDVSIQGYREEEAGEISRFDGSKARYQIVSHTVGGVRHYGAIVVPERDTADLLPVLVYAHGDDNGVELSGTVVLLDVAISLGSTEYIYVIPSFRSEPLTFAGRRYDSEGQPSPWDYDVDDALALLNVALETTPGVDDNRISVVGFSRGGGVALLMAERDPRIQRVVDFFGPTDFFGEYIQEITADVLSGTPHDLPGLDYLSSAVLERLKHRDMTIDQARDQLLRRSPVYFADRLPDVQIHHGEADPIVEVSQSVALIDVLEDLGRTEPGFSAYLYPGGVHDPFTLDGSISRTVQFLARPYTASFSAQREVAQMNP